MLDGVNLADVTGWAAFAGLCGLIVVGVLKGWIVPGPTARMWFEAWQTDRHTVELLSEQTKALAQGQTVITKLVEDLKHAGERANGDRS